jgi:hypothetical protein
MSQRAHVTSVEAIEAFRAQLILYLTRARATTEEVSDEIQRTRAWLEQDRRAHWERECRRCERVLDEAQQELLNARISRLSNQTAAQMLAVERAKRALREAEDKRAASKRWAREFGNRAEPLGKQVEQLLTFLATDMVKAVAHLGSVIKALDAYAAVQSESTGSSLSSSAAPDATTPEATPTQPSEMQTSSSGPETTSS